LVRAFPYRHSSGFFEYTGLIFFPGIGVFFRRLHSDFLTIEINLTGQQLLSRPDSQATIFGKYQPNLFTSRPPSIIRLQI
jgi:hypothetical protein